MEALIGGVIVLGGFHAMLILASIINIVRSNFTLGKKFAWCLVVILLPIIGVLLIHIKFKMAWFREKPYEWGVAEARADSGGHGDSGVGGE